MGRKLTHLAIALLALAGLSGGEEVSIKGALGTLAEQTSCGATASLMEREPGSRANKANLLVPSHASECYRPELLKSTRRATAALHETAIAGTPDAPLIEQSSRRLYFALAAADLGTTELALARGAREMNPLMGRRAVRIPVKLAAAEGFAALTDRLERDGHHGWAKVARSGALFIAAWAVQGNVRQVIGGRR